MSIKMRSIKITDSGLDGIHIEGNPGQLDLEDIEISRSGRYGIYHGGQEVDALELLGKVLQKAYTKEDKHELVEQVAYAVELAKEDPRANKHKILSILGEVLSRTNELAGIGAFILALYQSFHTGNPIDPMLLATLKRTHTIS